MHLHHLLYCIVISTTDYPICRKGAYVIEKTEREPTCTGVELQHHHCKASFHCLCLKRIARTLVLSVIMIYFVREFIHSCLTSPQVRDTQLHFVSLLESRNSFCFLRPFHHFIHSFRHLSSLLTEEKFVVNPEISEVSFVPGRIGGHFIPAGHHLCHSCPSGRGGNVR